MPPKVAGRPAPKAAKLDKKSRKALAQQQAMEEATTHAQKLYNQHEVQRIEHERTEKVQRDLVFLDMTLEKERLHGEKLAFVKVQREFVNEEKLAFQEHEKHMRWAHIPDASRLPDVSSQREINTFLGVWKEHDAAFNDFHAEDVVIASAPVNGTNHHSLQFIRGEQGMPTAKRKKLIDMELDMCHQAFELTKAIQLAQDEYVAETVIPVGGTVRLAGQTRANSKTMQEIGYLHEENLRNVNKQILAAMDFITVNAVMYYDVALDGTDPEKETLCRVLPEGRPIFKYGLWIKVKEATRSFTSLVFPDIDVRLDPKSSALPKLPKALGLSKENVAVRALQFSFNPFAGYDLRGREYYALDCTVKVDLLGFTHRPYDLGEWQLRSGTQESYTLQCQEYPSSSAEARVEDPAFRISFVVPQTLVIRQPSLLIGKWVKETMEWEPCSHVMFGASLGGGASARGDSNVRRATFTAGELAHFAVLQEKVFDAPYEYWSIRPISYDQVVVTLEGRRRGDASDRVIHILVENTQCKLLAPDDTELQALRDGWCAPVTLFRSLAQAGFNFLLHDEDARFLNNVVPKSAALETKAYTDIAQFCQFYSVASTRHNHYGEDPDVALFRLFKKPREIEEELSPYHNVEVCDDEWHHVRYQVSSCVLSAFTEDQDFPDLNVLQGHESHYNLFSLLSRLEGEDAIRAQLVNTNYLLRRCVLQILHLVRPLSWG